MNNKERDEKFLKSWLKKKISITTSTVVSFLITGAIGGGAAYGAGNKPGTGGNNNSVAWGQGSSVDNDSVAVGANASAVSASGGNNPTVTSKGVAIGNNAKAEGSVSIGDSASSTHFGVAVGYKAGVQNTTTGASFSNVTIGANTRVGVQGTQAAQGIAIGSGIQAHEGAWAKGDQSISIGANTTASGNSSIAIGGDDLLSVSTKTSSYSDARFDKNGNKIGVNDYNTKFEYNTPNYAPVVEELPILNLNSPKSSANSDTSKVEKNIVSNYPKFSKVEANNNSTVKALPKTGVTNTTSFTAIAALGLIALMLYRNKKNN